MTGNLIAIGLGSLLLTLLVLGLTLAVISVRAVLSPSRPVVVTVNGTRRIGTHSGQRLLPALLDDGVLVPSACAGAGTCGLCRVRVTAGGGEVLPTEAVRLSRADVKNGQRLACQVVLRGDIEVEVPEDLLGAASFECRVGAARFLTPLIREIVLQMPKGMHPRIVAGSFVQITAPPFALSYGDIAVPAPHQAAWENLRGLRVASAAPVVRAYSIANRPEDTAAGRLVLNVRVALPPPSLPGTPPGVVSSWLFSVQPGDQVRVSGPFGSFRAQDSTREMVVIGGGVGMAPLRAIIFDQLERLGTTRKISFWYGARSRAEVIYADEFGALAAKHPNFNWTVALSDPKPGDDWPGATGFVHHVVRDRLLRDHPSPEACEYYLCGPPVMIRAVLAMLEDAGVEKDAIFNDDFGI